MCLDKGYDYREPRELVAEFKFTAHIKSRGDEAKAIKRRAGSVLDAGSSNALTVG